VAIAIADEERKKQKHIFYYFAQNTQIFTHIQPPQERLLTKTNNMLLLVLRENEKELEVRGRKRDRMCDVFRSSSYFSFKAKQLFSSISFSLPSKSFSLLFPY